MQLSWQKLRFTSKGSDVMKKALVLLIAAMFVLAGCSSENTGKKETLQSESQTERQPSRNSDELASHVPAISPVEQERKAVYWSINEVRHLSELEQFMERIGQGLKDRLRIETTSKEGNPYVLDLRYDGEHIIITANVNSSERLYDNIVVSRRFNRHYKGEFIEYWAVSDNGNGRKELLLQIRPGLEEISP
jgi:TolA-binding protein